MILFLHGEDNFLLNRRRLTLQRAFVKKYSGAEIFIFDFEDQGTPENVRRALVACGSGLFAAEKLVVFLHPCELAEGSQKILRGFLEEQEKGSEEKVILLFVQPGKIKKTDPVAAALLKLADKEEVFPKIADKDIAALIRKELAAIDKEMAFARGALEAFVACVGTDTARLVSEIGKLAAYKAETKTIEAGDIALLLEEGKENLIFEALDTLGRGDRKRATLLFHQEAEKADSAFQLLSMCAWQVRRMLQVRDALDRGLRRPADIASQTRLAPFVVQKTLASIEGFPLPRIKRGLTMLSDFDTQLKTGGMDPQVALDLFIWKF